MELLWENRLLLTSGLLAQTMMFVLINVIYGKRERPWVFALTNGIHFVLMNVVFDIFMKERYGEELWFILLLPVLGNALAYTVVIIQSINWKESFVKMLLAFMFSDVFCGMTGYILYLKITSPVLMFLSGMIVLLIFCTVFSGLIKRYRNVKLYHPWLVGGFILYTTLESVFCRVIYVLQDENVISDAMFFIGMLTILFALGFILVEYIIFCFVLQRRHQMLLRNKVQMENYYHQVARHIREIDKAHILLEQGTDFFAAITETVPERENVNLEQSQVYLRELRAQYETLGEVFFCNDFAIDSVLREFVMNCREKGIKTDILFGKYDRGIVTAGDAAAILSRMLDYGLKTARTQKEKTIQMSERGNHYSITVQGASVKNQLIFSMTVTGERIVEKARRIRIKKRSFHPWTRKYNGIVHVKWEEDRMQMVVGLINVEE